MVFQSYALWPHMTVRKNIGYPLETRGIKGEKATQWIEEVAALVDTSALLDRYPAQLSGGQQQRVALSRGLVARPEIVLFDEPLSNLDARLRDLVRTEIHELHARIGFTAVYVTHDQVEALALGDRLAIMRAGRARATRNAEQVFEEPATDYVAGFIGMGNRLELERQDGALDARRRANRRARRSTRTPRRDRDLARGRRTWISPASSESAPHDALSFNGTIVDSEFGGRHMDVVLTIGETRVQSRIPARESGELGAHARAWAGGRSVDQADARSSSSTTPESFFRRRRSPVCGQEADVVDPGRWTTSCRWREGQTARIEARAYRVRSRARPISRCCRSSGSRSRRSVTTASRTATLSPEPGVDDRPVHGGARTRIARSSRWCSAPTSPGPRASCRQDSGS